MGRLVNLYSVTKGIDMAYKIVDGRVFKQEFVSSIDGPREAWIEVERFAYIRPVHAKDSGKLLSLALCRHNQEILSDGEIIDHFDADTMGKDIKEIAVEYGHATSVDHVLWGKPIEA